MVSPVTVVSARGALRARYEPAGESALVPTAGSDLDLHGWVAGRSCLGWGRAILCPGKALLPRQGRADSPSACCFGERGQGVITREQSLIPVCYQLPSPGWAGDRSSSRMGLGRRGETSRRDENIGHVTGKRDCVACPAGVQPGAERWGRRAQLCPALLAQGHRPGAAGVLRLPGHCGAVFWCICPWPDAADVRGCGTAAGAGRGGCNAALATHRNLLPLPQAR